jgi:hypothetical protein
MALREVLAKLGFEIDDSALKKANVNFDGFLSKVTNLKGVLGGALAGVGLGLLKGQVDELASESGELNKAAIKAGVGFEEFQAISYTTGLGVESLTGLFRKLQQNVAAAGGKASEASSDFADIDGGLGKILDKKQASETFKQLGINVSEAGGKAKSNADLFEEVADRLREVKKPAEQTALAIRIFGRSGSDLIPFLQKSPEAIRAAADEFELFGGITEENRKTLAAYGKEQKRLDLISKSLRATIVSTLAPALTFLFQKFNEGVSWVKKNIDTSQLLYVALGVLTTAFVALGWSAALAWLKALIGPALVAAAVLLLIAVVDDLIHFFKGDAKTATEDLIKLLFGKEAGESWIAEIRKDAHDLIEDLKGIEGIGGKVKELFKAFAFAISDKGTPLNNWALGGEVSDVPLAVSSGAAGRAKGKARRTQAEQELQVSLPPDFGQALSTPKPLASFAPTVPVPGQKPTNQTIDAKSNVQITQNIYGDDAKDAADQSVEGIKGVLKTSNQATLNALEVRK